MATSSENWKQEAEGVINDIKSHVNKIEISRKLDITDSKIYLNIRTLEGQSFCIELSNRGFRIIGNGFDEFTTESDIFYETPYSLLNQISEKFKESFANSLQIQLNNLLS